MENTNNLNEQLQTNKTELIENEVQTVTSENLQPIQADSTETVVQHTQTGSVPPIIYQVHNTPPKEPFSKKYPNVWKYVTTGILSFLAGMLVLSFANGISHKPDKFAPSQQSQGQMTQKQRGQMTQGNSNQAQRPGANNTSEKPAQNTTNNESNTTSEKAPASKTTT